MKTQNRISQFDTEWSELSNFACSPLSYDGKDYLSAEHAFQSAKVNDPENKHKVRSARTAGEAKILGNLFKDSKNWDEIKVTVMLNILRAKFSQNMYLADLLLSTSDAFLEEGNTWGDVFWGTTNGIGQNHLGTLLMAVRDELRTGKLIISDVEPTKQLLPSGPMDFKLNHPHSTRKV